MFEPAGASQHVAFSETLGLVVAPSLLALAANAVVASGVGGERDAARRGALATAIGLGGIGLSVGIALGHAALFFSSLDPARVLVQYVIVGPRVGDADASLVLVFDAMSAAACVLVCSVALPIALWLAMRPPAERGPAAWAGVEMALSGALLSFLADGWVVTAMGWTLSIAAGSWIAGWKSPHTGALAATRGAVALAALTLGFVSLFWTLGERPSGMDGRDLVDDREPRFVAIPSAPSYAGTGTLTLATDPGALVYVDDARAPLAVAPFAGVAVPWGAHVLRVRPRRATEEMLVSVEIPEQGVSLTLIRAGSSLSFRDIAATLATAPRSPAAGALALVLCLWASAAWWVSTSPALVDAPLPLAALVHGATTVFLGPFLLARATVLLPFVPVMKAALPAVVASILVASVAALWAAASGRVDSDKVSTALLERAPRRAGGLLVRFDRWVLDAVAGAVVTSLRCAVWAIERLGHAPSLGRPTRDPP